MPAKQAPQATMSVSWNRLLQRLCHPYLGSECSTPLTDRKSIHGCPQQRWECAGASGCVLGGCHHACTILVHRQMQEPKWPRGR